MVASHKPQDRQPTKENSLHSGRSNGGADNDETHPCGMPHARGTARRVQCLVRGEYETGVRQGVKRGGVPGGSRGNLVGVDWCQAGREAGCKAGWCLLRMEPVAFSLIPMLLGKPDKCLKDGERGCIHLSKVKRCFTCPSPC